MGLFSWLQKYIFDQLIEKHPIMKSQSQMSANDHQNQSQLHLTLESVLNYMIFFSFLAATKQAIHFAYTVFIAELI